MPIENIVVEAPKQQEAKQIEKAKKRMLEWPNPVEYVNNMYGCHPGDDGEYFKAVFGDLNKRKKDNE